MILALFCWVFGIFLLELRQLAERCSDTAHKKNYVSNRNDKFRSGWVKGDRGAAILF